MRVYVRQEKNQKNKEIQNRQKEKMMPFSS
jgi:hypothetical protein